MALMASQRDASWYGNPSTNGVKRWHIVSSDGRTPGCGASMLLIAEMAINAADVATSSRCQRPGCKQLWPQLGQGTN